MPMNVNKALIMITLKMDCTTAVFVRSPTAAAPPLACSPWPHAINPIAIPRNGALTRPTSKWSTVIASVVAKI
jgi:hypothetical protein